jgi:glycerol-3-phosphate O-acyltransferase/dihydroxyacetone phosphate acyltransferase
VFYRLVRATVSLALRLFYRLQVDAKPIREGGPVIFVGNHPNGLIDPALVFVLTHRQVTFLAKEPLFRVPVIGWLLRGLGALPVYRKQDNPSQMAKNEGTFEAASGALVQGRAITLFPEGKSHSEPQLAEIKTGAARIAFRAAKQGAKIRIVPVGLTYQEKHRFRSRVLIEVGESMEVASFVPQGEGDEVEAVRALTAAIADRLRSVTLNLEQWEDLPIIQTAEELYSLRLGEATRDPDRLRRFAKGMQILREEQPERYRTLRGEVASFRRRLGLVRAGPSDLSLVYQRAAVWKFAFKNLSALLLGLPLFAAGVILFAVPFYAIRWLTDIVSNEWDDDATVKFLASVVVTPIWAAILTALAWWLIAPWAAVVTLVGVLPLALFTRYFFEGRISAVRDALVFFALGSRGRLKGMLLAEGERIASGIEQVAVELRSRLEQPAVAQ